MSIRTTRAPAQQLADKPKGIYTVKPKAGIVYLGSKNKFMCSYRVPTDIDVIIDAFGGACGGTIGPMLQRPRADVHIAETNPTLRYLAKHYMSDKLDKFVQEVEPLIDTICNVGSWPEAQEVFKALWIEAYLGGEKNQAIGFLPSFGHSGVTRTSGSREDGTLKINTSLSGQKITGDKWDTLGGLFLDRPKPKTDNEVQLWNADLCAILWNHEVFNFRDAMKRRLYRWAKERAKIADALAARSGRVHWYSDTYAIPQIDGDHRLVINDPPYYQPNHWYYNAETLPNGKTKRRKGTQHQSYAEHATKSIETWHLCAHWMDYATQGDIKTTLITWNYESEEYLAKLHDLKSRYDHTLIAKGKLLPCVQTPALYKIDEGGEKKGRETSYIFHLNQHQAYDFF